MLLNADTDESVREGAAGLGPEGAPPQIWLRLAASELDVGAGVCGVGALPQIF